MRNGDAPVSAIIAGLDARLSGINIAQLRDTANCLASALLTSWPGLSRPSTSCFNFARKAWMAGMKPAMTTDDGGVACLDRDLPLEIKHRASREDYTLAGQR